MDAGEPADVAVFPEVVGSKGGEGCGLNLCVEKDANFCCGPPCVFAVNANGGECFCEKVAEAQLIVDF